MEVLVGTRVVRGPDWSWREQDGGDGYLGTVAEVQAPGPAGSSDERSRARVVTVQWDCGGRCRYRCGLGGKYDLRGFDSGPAGVVHVGEVCCVCGLDPITGTMWKCARCLEFSICTECYMAGKHVLSHDFDRFVTSRERVRMPARGDCKRRESTGMFKYAEVVPWCDWEHQEGTEPAESGEIVRLCGKKDDDNSRGFVEVEWKESSTRTVHMVGHKGKVELKSVDLSSGGYYYPDHLPLLGAPLPEADPAVVSTGDRVRVELEPEVFQAMQEGRNSWNDVMLSVIGKVGTVVGITESGDLKVRYSSENIMCNICAEAVVKVEGPHFKVGDVVRVSSDMEKVRSLQQGHGDWSSAVLLMMSEVGRVYAVHPGGDVLVMGKGKSWVFNPLCLSHAADDKEETAEDNPFTTWAKKDVDEEVKFGLTAMVENGRGEAVFIATSLGEGDLLREFLTKYPAMVDHASDGRTPLHYAASAGLAKPMKILLEFNANIELQDDTSTRPLHTSVFHGSTETTQLLIDAGADVNAQTVGGSTPLIFAASYGKTRSLKVLLTSPNLNISIQDETGNTALHHAVMSQKVSCVRPLLEAGADPCMFNFSLMTPLHYAARMGSLPVIEAFLEHEPSWVNSKGESSFAILHLAAFTDHVDMITLAMETRDCDVDSRSDQGQTPLHVAVGRGNTKSVEKLVMYGASVNAVDQVGSPPLYYLTSCGEGVDPPNEDSPMTYKLYKALFGKYGNEPTTIMYGIMAVSAFLLRKGADIHLANHQGRTPFQVLPFFGTLMTVLADYEDIIEEGGHPDGSPLLRFSEKQTHGHGGKKALVSLYAEGSGHDEEYSGGQQRTVMIIRAPSGFADHVSFTEKKRGKSRGGASSGATPSGAGPGMYQDLNESYTFSFCDDDDDHYTSRGRSKPSKTSQQSASNSTASSTTYSSAGATPWATSTRGATPRATGATPGTTGATGATPRATGATPGTTGATGATPRATGATPGTTGATPRATGATPVTTGATPRATGATPGTTGATPRATGATPGTTGATPRATGATPGTTGATSGTTGATPEATSGTTRATGATPGTTGATPETTRATGATPETTRATGATPGTTGATHNGALFENPGGATRRTSPSSSRRSPVSTDSDTASRSASSQPAPPPPTSVLTPSSSPVGDDLCCMCDNVVDVKFNPCGHAAMCSGCAPKVKRCPFCKTAVSGVYGGECVNCRKRESKLRQNCGHWMCYSCRDSPICAGCNAPDD